jgi:hypothetical protein
MPTPTDPFFVVIRFQTYESACKRRAGRSSMTLRYRRVPRAVTLRAPTSSLLEIYYLAGTYTRSSAEETLVRSLRIYPD